MKKVFVSTMLALVTCGAIASDGGIYTETETFTNQVKLDFNTVTYYDDVVVAKPGPVAPRPCGKERVASSIDVVRPCPCAAAAEPVSVKTHTEVIDHYQVYKPVTKYVPAGTYTTRRVIESPRCKNCNG